MTWATLNLFLLGTLLSTTINGQQCKNDLGEPVDWFLASKPPALKTPSNPLLQKGVGYLYVSAKNPSVDWKLSSKSINDSSSFLGQTLSSLYTDSAEKLLYLMYNDEPPTAMGNTIYGHSKGVIITDGEVGFWLVHSSPKFPIEPITDVNKSKDSTTSTPMRNKYFFPKTATRFGQSFLCITLLPKQLEKVGLALHYIKPKIYSQNIPNALANKFPELGSVANKKFKKVSQTLKTTLTTLGGRHFVSYAKGKDFNQDLYTGWLAPDLQSDLQVETWSNGPNELPSDCKSKYHVMDVKNVEIQLKNESIKFKNSQDHSKWAVTVNSNTTTVCIGDINRMLAQFKRGGGTVCYKNAMIWKKYSKAVADVHPCTVNSNFSGETSFELKIPTIPPASFEFPSPLDPDFGFTQKKTPKKNPDQKKYVTKSPKKEGNGAQNNIGLLAPNATLRTTESPETVTTNSKTENKNQKKKVL